jgi:hypothetical protein
MISAAITPLTLPLQRHCFSSAAPIIDFRRTIIFARLPLIHFSAAAPPFSFSGFRQRQLLPLIRYIAMPRHAPLRATPLFVDAIIDAAFFHADTPPMPLSLILIAEDAAFADIFIRHCRPLSAAIIFIFD